MSSPPPKKAKKRGQQGEGGSCPRKQACSGQSITQQLLDDVLHGTPWDDDLSGASTALTREEKADTCDMAKDIREMAKDADRQNGLIGSSFYVFLHVNPQLTCNARVPLYPTHTVRQHGHLFPCIRGHHI
jgi:hypothetical protein